MTIQPNSINQKQSIREPRIYSAVPRDVMVHIVENIRGVDDPVRLFETMNARVERYKNEGMLTVGADLHLP